MSNNGYLGFKEAILKDEDANSFFSSENRERFAYIRLLKTERSEAAAMADLLD